MFLVAPHCGLLRDDLTKISLSDTSIFRAKGHGEIECDTIPPGMHT